MFIYSHLSLSLSLLNWQPSFYNLCTQDLLDALNQLEIGLKDNLKKLSSFEKYKQQVLLGHLDWSPMHKDPSFWRENINNFEENDFQVCFVLYWMGNIPINILWNFSKTIGDSLCLPLFQVIPWANSHTIQNECQNTYEHVNTPV